MRLVPQLDRVTTAVLRRFAMASWWRCARAVRAVVSTALVAAAALPRPALAQPRPRADVVAAVATPAGTPHRRWRYVVVHHSGTPGGSAAAFAAYHRGVRRFARGLAYHFVIGNGRGAADGAIEAGPRWRLQQPGAHVASALREREAGARMDEVAIGVCLVGDFTASPPTARQRAALVELVAHLQRRYGIAADHVLGHGEVDGARTDCPGRGLGMARLRREFAPARRAGAARTSMRCGARARGKAALSRRRGARSGSAPSTVGRRG